MEQKQNLSYNYLIIHPGETLSEILEDRGITQNQLSKMTDVSEKYIDDIITGKKSISLDFAKMLDRALNIDFSFWVNLQTDYDNELQGESKKIWTR